MLGFSIGKILFTALVVFGVWMLFKQIQRRNALRGGKRPETLKEKVERAAREATERRTGKSADQEPPKPVTDLVECPDCGRFIPENTRCECGWKP